MPKLDAYELRAMLQAERLDALGVNTSQLASERSRALDYYYGNMSGDMPNFDGRSSAVSTDVADVIEGLMPALMDIFASTEEPVKFNAVGPEDEAAADQETDYVNHIFMQKNPGFLILYSFIKDALLSKVGIVKVAWETTERESTETYYGIGQDELAVILQDPDVDVTKRTDNPDGTYDVEVACKKDYGCAKVYPVPPEEFGISKRARTLLDCAYCYHEPANITESDLIAQGYDEQQIKSLPTMSYAPRIETLSRDTVEMGSRAQTAADEVNRAMRPIRLTEHYIRMDYEGNGKVKLYKIVTGADELVVLEKGGKPDVVEVDTMPFACMTPIIVTHRFFGRSIADLLIDIQKIKTALYRAMLDNMYLANNQRQVVDMNLIHERTLDDLLVAKPGGIVRVKGQGAIIPLQNAPIGEYVFPLIEYIDSVREQRSGFSMQSQGLDANALQNQTATAVNIAMTATQAKMKLIARIFAETGIRDLFNLLHKTIRQNDKEANTVRLRNQWITVDPRNWKTRDDLTVTVGLGTGSKEAQIAHLMTVLNIQKQMMEGQLPTASPKNVYNAAAKLAEKIDLKQPELYFTDPDSPQAQQMMAQKAQQPNPDMIKVQAQAQLEHAKAQSQVQLQAAQLQGDMAAERARMQADMQLEQQKFEHEKQLALLKMQADYEHQLRDMQLKHDARLAEIHSNHQVGELKVKADADAGTAKAISPVLDQVGRHMEKVGTHLANLSELTAKTLHAASSPRKTQLIRGANGKPEGAVSTIVEQ